MSVTMTVSASLKHVQNSPNRSRRRVYRCGWTTAITLRLVLVRAADQHRRNFHWVVTVIVDYRDIVYDTCASKTPFYATEITECAADDIRLDTDFTGDRDRG